MSILQADCARCRGACCEEFSLPLQLAGSDAPTEDANRWFLFHATVRPSGLFFECRCTKLTQMGRCSIYDSRPSLCAAYEAGGLSCIEVVRRRRTPEQQAAIFRKREEPA